MCLVGPIKSSHFIFIILYQLNSLKFYKKLELLHNQQRVMVNN